MSDAPAHIEALDVVVEVLSEVEDGATGDAFYGRLCEAVCRVTSMERAVIFRYDGTRRRVRAVGTHGIELERFADLHVTVESAPLAQRALAEDRVIEVSEHLERELPPEVGPLLDDMRLTCTPMAAAGRWVGVILSDRGPEAPDLSERERHLLWTLGKTAALASVARIATSAGERARQLEQRIDLAREVHDRVIQRLFGVSLALGADGDLSSVERARAAEELHGALVELRLTLQRPLGRSAPATQATFAEEVERLDVVVEGGDVAAVPPALEPLAQSVLAEAVRNARKHARPSAIRVRVGHVDGAFVLEVVNDGVQGRARTTGMGLRLAAFEALHHGGIIEFGPRDPDCWQVRLVVPSDVAG